MFGEQQPVDLYKFNVPLTSGLDVKWEVVGIFDRPRVKCIGSIALVEYC